MIMMACPAGYEVMVEGEEGSTVLAEYLQARMPARIQIHLTDAKVCIQFYIKLTY